MTSCRLGGGLPALPNTSVSDIMPLDSYTYADLAEAVDMLHQGGAPPAPSAAVGAPLQEPRSSAMLMDYLSSRIGHPEGNGALSSNERARYFYGLGVVMACFAKRLWLLCLQGSVPAAGECVN